jgi:hypothetical protein
VSTRQEKVRKHTSMFVLLEEGTYERIPCPECEHDAVFAWFTQPRPNEYKIWFVCTDCSMQSRVQVTGRPASFREDRVHPGLQKYDEDIAKQLKSPTPE